MLWVHPLQSEFLGELAHGDMGVFLSVGEARAESVIAESTNGVADGSSVVIDKYVDHDEFRGGYPDRIGSWRCPF
jgi:hypothetical protein